MKVGFGEISQIWESKINSWNRIFTKHVVNNWPNILYPQRTPKKEVLSYFDIHIISIKNLHSGYEIAFRRGFT